MEFDQEVQEMVDDLHVEGLFLELFLGFCATGIVKGGF
jgi:hypothetical protein